MTTAALAPSVAPVTSPLARTAIVAGLVALAVFAVPHEIDWALTIVLARLFV